jgi:hypothetical protein
MTNEEFIRDQCLAVLSEAGVADVEAYCAASGITLGDWLEAIATRPGGACDMFGVHVDSASGRRMAMLLKAASLLEQAETMKIVLSGDRSAMFGNPTRA